jgi:hypothetical protein
MACRDWLFLYPTSANENAGQFAAEAIASSLALNCLPELERYLSSSKYPCCATLKSCSPFIR